jgi:hypothetical protein
MVNIKTTTTIEISKEDVIQAIKFYISMRDKLEIPKGDSSLFAYEIGYDFSEKFILTIHHD